MKTIGRYTSDAKRVFKFKKNGFRKLYCQVDGKDIYVSNSYVIFKMTADEYDKIVRPNCDRNPGDWVIDRGGNEYTSYDLKSYFESCASASNLLKNSHLHTLPMKILLRISIIATKKIILSL